MLIAMLGPLEVRTVDGAPVEVSGVRLRTLLTVLALEPGRVVTVSRLVDGVWGEHPPSEAANALQALVSRLRRVLPDGVVVSDPTGYRLAVEPDAVDVGRFERLVADGRATLAADPSVAAATLRTALGLWRGSPLADVAEAEFAQAPIARLAELALVALADRIDADLRLGADVDALVAELEALLAGHPLRERFAVLLMRALRIAGRRNEALAVYQRVRTALADQLGADPSAELAELHLAMLRGESEPTRRPDTNLRAGLTSFVGRDEELTTVADMVARSRLVTLTGPGGSGKTRLATEVARTLVDGQPDGVWLVELAPLTDGAELAAAVLGALGIRAGAMLASSQGHVVDVDPATRLAAALSTRSALLVLDNCEHVIGPAAALADRLLGECSRLRVLATSREPLGITGETLWPVDPLALPPEGATAAAALDFAAVRLLADRAAAVRPGFRVDEETVAAVVRICRALDGMPLAIELAAARLRTMAPDQVAARLDDRFRLLTGGSRMALPRHQTLRAVVDWSWDLLDDAERTLLRRLAVFTGGASLEAVEHVCGLPDSLDVLTALIDKSLVIPMGDGSRYGMLETIKAYGLERLAEAGELAEVRHAYADYFAGLAERAEPHLRRATQLAWLELLARDHDNLHAALRVAIADRDPVPAARLLSTAGWYWWLYGHKTEGADLAKELFTELGTDLDVPGELRALALSMGALLAIDGVHDMPSAIAWFTEAVELAEHLDPERPLLRLIGPLFEVLATYGRPAEPVRLDVIDRLLDGEEDQWVVGTALAMRAHAVLNAGRQHPAAEADFRAALAAFRSIGERWGTSFTLCSLGDVLAWRGELAEALPLFREAVDLFSTLVNNDDLVRYRLRLASLHEQLGEHDAAQTVVAVAQREAERSGIPDCLAGVAHTKGDFARLRGDLATARAELAKAAEWAAHATAAPQFRAYISASIGYLAATDGDLDTAARRHAEAVEWALEGNDAPMIAQTLVGVAEVRMLRGNPAEAAEIFSASNAIRGVPDLSFVDSRRVEAAVRAALGDAEFAEATARGATATIDTVRDLVKPAV